MLYSDASEQVTPIRESEVADPADMMAIGDSFDFSTNGEFVEYLFSREVFFVFRNNKAISLSSRHGGHVNVLFCDGHIESPTLQFLFQDTSDAALTRWNRDHKPHREELGP
jgi:prepilin-type processing-associated H-X9-DG protein